MGSLQVSIISLQGRYPGEASVDIIAGINKIYLSNYGNLTGFVTAYGKQYLIELSSASSQDATIEVRKCTNESATLIEIADNPILNNTANATNTNSTLNETNITTNGNSTSNQTVNYSSNQTNNTQDNTTTTQNGQKNNEDNTVKYITLGGLIFFVILFLVLLIKYIKNRASEKEERI